VLSFSHLLWEGVPEHLPPAQPGSGLPERGALFPCHNISLPEWSWCLWRLIAGPSQPLA
jgi:hypothetical protein